MKKNKKNLFYGYLLTVIACCFANAVYALESDAQQPITIDSNTATYDDSTATSTYAGNVVCLQGSIRVNSDRLIVYLKNGEVEKLLFTGNPSRFKQTPNAGSEDIIGEALTGEYYPKDNLLIMIDNAIVKQGNATYASKLIQYDIKNSLVRAGEKSSDAKRVHVILKPKAK